MSAQISWLDASDLRDYGIPWGYAADPYHEDGFVELPDDDAIKQDALLRLERVFTEGIRSGSVTHSDRSQLRGRTDRALAQDAAEVFWTNTLEQTLASIMRRPKTTGIMTGADPVLPIKRTLRPGQLAGVYNIETTTGQAAWLEPNGMRKLPQVGEFSERKRYTTGFIGIGYGVGLVEMWTAAERGQPLESMRRMTAEHELGSFAERVLLYGDVGHDAPGWLQNAQSYHQLLGGNFTGDISAPATAQLKLQIMEKFFKVIGETYSTDARITGVIAPRDDLRAFQRMRWSNDAPAWPDFLQMHPWLSLVRWVEHIETAGPGGGPLWVMWSDDPNELWSELDPVPMLFGPWQDNGPLRQSWAVIQQIGGVVLRRRERAARFEFNA